MKKFFDILSDGVTTWNTWREENPDLRIDFKGVELVNTDLTGANLSKVDLSNAKLYRVNLSEAVAIGAKFNDAKLNGAILNGSTLRYAKFQGADLSGAELKKANLTKANLANANLAETNLKSAVFKSAILTNTNLVNADLTKANLKGANLAGADLRRANLTQAKLLNANLRGASLVSTIVTDAVVTGSSVYAINVWDLEGKFSQQEDMIITRAGEPVITVDNLKIAQFIYLILNNEEIRNVLNTLTSKSVLILGRFSLPKRKDILDELRKKLREYDLLPIVFDFDRPTDKDFTETIHTLAGLCFFVIADITNPKSAPLELQATIPDYQIPFVPIIQEREAPFSMMANLQTKYDWVLDTLEYDSKETLIKVLKPAIIEPAVAKHNELQLKKARRPKIRSATDFLGK